MKIISPENFSKCLINWEYKWHHVDIVWEYFQEMYEDDPFVKIYQDDYKDRYYITDNKNNPITSISYIYNNNYKLLLSFIKFEIERIETMKKWYFK